MKFLPFDVQHSLFIIHYFLGTGLPDYELRNKNKKIPLGDCSKGNLSITGMVKTYLVLFVSIAKFGRNKNSTAILAIVYFIFLSYLNLFLRRNNFMAAGTS